ncbi:MAG: UDP-N-acetylmuramoyl-L-alanine--D-glutamate ligase [Candidatus Accumulibacter sp.]|jgi:UDP-N-acetylmuramoylalanine--D-glutamate ligase|nr:UDP-N-acetylmuramoyl-L-alanine--D-glutamate ligase [Accumulibacter sp.]
MELSGKHALVLGSGESGLAMARWLVRQGAAVRVADSRTAPPNAEALRAMPVELLAGPFSEAAFADADCIAISPGVPVRTPQVGAAIARGVPVLSEIELFAQGIRRHAPDSRVIAITGSNGKTTTTALTAHLLNSAGIGAVACGNISPSALDALMALLEDHRLPQVWVLELSSFQLETTRSLKADAAALLNLSEDHLDRYASFDDYARAKARVFTHASTARVLNRDDERSMIFGVGAPDPAPGGVGAELPAALALAMENPGVSTFGLTPPPRARHYGLDGEAIFLGEERLIGLDELPIQGLHNAANAMAALALCRALGVEARRVLPALRAFRGLPHRVELVARIRGVAYYDDSKGTNVGATLAALRGLGCRVALILGGEGKNQDFSPLKPALAEHARAVALIGRDAAPIGRAIDGCGAATRHCRDLEDAVRWCASAARPGDAVLLSPACASFDMFRDYAHRAEVFAGLVRALETEAR